MDNRNRRSPVTLSRDTPVPESEIDCFLAQSFGFKRVDDGIEPSLEWHAVKGTRIHQGPLIGVGRLTQINGFTVG